jgi:hypothetical protein
MADEPHLCISESPFYVGRAVVALPRTRMSDGLPGRRSRAVSSPPNMGSPNTDGTQPDAWRYIAEVQAPDNPADDTGYR